MSPPRAGPSAFGERGSRVMALATSARTSESSKPSRLATCMIWYGVSEGRRRAISGSSELAAVLPDPAGRAVPHPTTLMKLTTRCGEAAVAGLNEALLARAAGQKLLHTARVRADTTVIPADVACPTDSGLLARAVGKLVRTAGRVRAAGGGPAT